MCRDVSRLIDTLNNIYRGREEYSDEKKKTELLGLKEQQMVFPIIPDKIVTSWASRMMDGAATWKVRIICQVHIISILKEDNQLYNSYFKNGDHY